MGRITGGVGRHNRPTRLMTPKGSADVGVGGFPGTGHFILGHVGWGLDRLGMFPPPLPFRVMSGKIHNVLVFPPNKLFVCLEKTLNVDT